MSVATIISSKKPDPFSMRAYSLRPAKRRSARNNFSADSAGALPTRLYARIIWAGVMMNTKLFSELGLSPELLKAIDKLGFEKASPIQAEAIPLILEGRDVVGQSQTGSGKTAAFAIPAIEKIDPQLRVVQAIILCP